MHPILALIYTVLDILSWLIIASVIVSWLVAFNVINTRNQFVANIAYMLDRITEPILGPIRRVIPAMGGIDISPLVALVLIWFVQYSLAYYF
jgi:YggT family protein